MWGGTAGDSCLHISLHFLSLISQILKDFVLVGLLVDLMELRCSACGTVLTDQPDVTICPVCGYDLRDNRLTGGKDDKNYVILPCPSCDFDLKAEVEEGKSVVCTACGKVSKVFVLLYPEESEDAGEDEVGYAPVEALIGSSVVVMDSQANQRHVSLSDDQRTVLSHAGAQWLLKEGTSKVVEKSKGKAAQAGVRMILKGAAEKAIGLVLPR